MMMLNNCRLYLKVLTASDIATADGRNVLVGAMEGIRSRNSQMEWPKQVNMPSEAWKLWATYLRKSVTGNPRSTSLEIQRSMRPGRWMTTDTQLWDCCIDECDNTLYARSNNKFIQFNGRRGLLRRKWIFDKEGQTVMSRSDISVPTDVVTTDDDEVFGVTYASRVDVEHEVEETEFMRLYRSEDVYIQELLETVEMPNGWTRNVAEGMKQGTLNVAADGGLKGRMATFGVVIDWKDDRNQVRCRGPADFSHDATNTLRPELYGAWMAFKLIEMALKLENVSKDMEMSLTIYADNKEAVKRANGNNKYIIAQQNEQGENTMLKWKSIA